MFFGGFKSLFEVLVCLFSCLVDLNLFLVDRELY